jgi:hypothetical protein
LTAENFYQQLAQAVDKSWQTVFFMYLTPKKRAKNMKRRVWFT